MQLTLPGINLMRSAQRLFFPTSSQVVASLLPFAMAANSTTVVRCPIRVYRLQMRASYECSRRLVAGGDVILFRQGFTDCACFIWVQFKKGKPLHFVWPNISWLQIQIFNDILPPESTVCWKKRGVSCTARGFFARSNALLNLSWDI